MLTLVHAWRNLWRNGRRTAINASAIAVSTAVLIFTFALLDGSMRAMERNATELAVGEAQVHAPGWLAERSMYQAIEAPERVLEAAAGQGAAAAARSMGFGLLSSGPRSAGVQIWGVDPGAEGKVGRLPQHLARGEWLPGGAAGRVVLGAGLARTLGAEPGAELVAVVQAADGSMGNEVLRVVGVLEGISEGMDRSVALVDRRDFDSLFVAEGRVHEVVLSSQGEVEAGALAAAAREAAPGLDVRSWRELLPVMVNMLNIWTVARWMISLIFVVAAGLGVLNTMLMATFERTPELGLVRALGATPGRVVLDVAAEALLLGAFSAGIGAALGVGVATWAQVHGIDLSGLGAGNLSIAGVTLETTWRAHLTPGAVVQPVIVTLGVTLLAALYPAVRASRLDPVQAMGHV